MQSASIVAALAAGILTARLLGPAGKGIYALPLVEMGLVASAFAGLSSATSYFLLNQRAGRQILAPLTIATIAFVLVGAAGVLAASAAGHALWAAGPAIAALPAAAATAGASGYAVGIKRVRFVSITSAATVVVTLVLTATGLFLVSRSPFVAIAAWVAGTTLVGAAAWLTMLWHSRRLEPGEPVDLKRYLWLALKAGATALVTLLNYRADLYIVAIMLSPRDLGLYSVATSAPQALLFPARVAATVTSPHIGGLDRTSAAALAARCARHSVLVSALICAIVFVLAPFIVRLLYGSAFLPLVPALRVLLVGLVALAGASPISSFYELKLARPEISLGLASVSAVICIAATILLIPRFGIVGAATASSLGYIFGQALALWYFKRSTRIGFSATLVPTAIDVRLYAGVLRGLWQDGSRLLRRTARADG